MEIEMKNKKFKLERFKQKENFFWHFRFVYLKTKSNVNNKR